MNNYKIKLLLIMGCVCLILTSCRKIEQNVQENILKCVKESGYIEEDDTLKYTSTVISDAIPTIMAYDYIYDREGSLYSIRIDTSDEDTMQYEVHILYDVQLHEYYATDGKQSSFDVADYGSSIDLIVDLENNKVEMIEQ